MIAVDGFHLVAKVNETPVGALGIKSDMIVPGPFRQGQLCADFVGQAGFVGKTEETAAVARGNARRRGSPP